LIIIVYPQKPIGDASVVNEMRENCPDVGAQRWSSANLPSSGVRKTKFCCASKTPKQINRNAMCRMLSFHRENEFY
jgi:hypothetical protein